MSNIYRTSLLPFRSRSQSDPTSPTQHHSFSVDRTSTIHTIFTMLDTDGCHDPKPRSPTMPPPHIATYNRNPRSIGMRKRFVNLFTSSKNRTDTSVSTAPDVIEAPSNTGTPIRFISPRATDSVPASSPRTRQHTFSFVHRQGNRKAKLSQDLSNHQSMAEHVVPEGNHVLVRDGPYLLPPRNDSVAMPGSPSKGTALTSHPVSGLDEMFNRSNERFETPMSGRSEVFGHK